jgi:esterase/lipase superfamily enzyme
MAIRAHVDWLKEGVTRWNRRRKKVLFTPDLSGLKFFDQLPPDFREAPKASRYFEKIDLSGADLTNADLSHLNFRKANFNGANLTSSDLSLSNFDEARFEGAALRDVDARKSSFVGATFIRSSPQEMKLDNAELASATFIGVDLPDDQRVRLASLGAEFYSTVAEFRESRRSIGSARPDGVLGLQVKSAPDTGKTRKNKYDVFFGTNREPIVEQGALVDFSGKRGSKIEYGLCEVIIPEGHKIGEIGTPTYKKLFNKADDSLRIDSTISLNEELFFSHLKITADTMRISETPTIFVHGFNNSFKYAVLRAAQIGYDLGIGQGIGLFSWPSKGKFLGYGADEAAADAAKYLLADFIEKFVENSSENSVNIIAHSMGCRCLLGAFEILSIDRKHVLKCVNQAILAAADVDAGIMPTIGRNATMHCTRTTSYISDQDKALLVSGWLRNFPRVGVTPPTYVMNGMDTVLVNKLDLGDFSHGYVGTSRAILNDMYSLLKDNEEPSKRYSLVAEGLNRWRIKE